MRYVTPFVLLLALGCTGGKGNSGGDTPASPTSKLAYTDPASTGWRISILKSASTDLRPVLSLYGPQSQQVVATAVTVTFDPALRVEELEAYVGRPSLIIRKGRQQFMGTADGSSFNANQPMQSWAVTLAAPKLPGDLSLAAVKLQVVTPDGKVTEQNVALGQLKAVP